MAKRIAVVLAISFCCGLVPAANEKIDSDINWRIRQEETDHSQVMRLVHKLTDIYGPRLTGSPNFNAACEWAISQMKAWGLQNEHLEKWDFGHPGWANDQYSVRVLSPYRALLDARIVAWTPSTKGPVRAQIVQIIPPGRPTKELLEAYLDMVKDKVRDRIVLVGAHVQIPVAFNASVKRLDDSELRTQYDADNTAPPKAPEAPADALKPLDGRVVDERIDAFLLANRALVKITDSGRPRGQIRVFANRTYNSARAVPSLVIRNEDYGRLSRVLADGSDIEMEIQILNTVYSDPLSFNAIAEIPGTDQKEQVVMMGGHIDSWHAGVGATDNAAGVAVMMEAARILQKLDAKPRRTIRIALWGGEEQGMLGSKAYVRDHFGSFEWPKPEFPSLSAYVNLDSGTGRVRGAFIFGPPEAAGILRQFLRPFADLGVAGVNSIQNRSYGNTDSQSFNLAGLPGIKLSQDPIEYETDTWHTNLDTYERVLEGDLKQCAIVVASLVYHLATRDEVLPRYERDAMPPPPQNQHQ
jgi:carboxypeptidase Q